MVSEEEAGLEVQRLHEAINPAHYRSHPSRVECIEITEWMNFCLGNAVKYIWRAGLKGDSVEDLNKAVWYLEREISRIRREAGSEEVPTQTDQTE